MLAIHGMSGNMIENYFGNTLGEKLAENGIGFIYAHNRGYGHINDIATRPMKAENNGWNYTRVGAIYEVFEDSLKDIAAWVEKARDLDYKRIVLLGHSLGCNKAIYYLYRQPNSQIAGLILGSPPDMNGLVTLERYQRGHDKLLEQARMLIKSGESRTILDEKIWDWYELSAQTYISLFDQGGAADNLPVLRNPEHFAQLAGISQPILSIYGEHDDIEIRTLQEDMELIRSKATSCPSFQIRRIAGANHTYENREGEFGQAVLEWIEMLA